MPIFLKFVSSSMASCCCSTKIHHSIHQSSLPYQALIQTLPLLFPFRLFSSQQSDTPNLQNHKDWLSPNEVIKIFQTLKNPNSALNVLTQLSNRKDYKPNQALYTTIINKLAETKNFDAIQQVMTRIKAERSYRLTDDFFYNVIKIYGNVGGLINRAIETLFDMPNYHCWPTIKTFNFVLNLLVCSRQYDIIHEVYVSAPKLGVEIDACCLNIIIKGLCGCGDLDAAFYVLDEFPKQNCVPNVRTFSTLMHGLCERGRVGEAFELLERMEREGIDPDTITFNILISGLRKQGRISESAEVFERMMLKGCDPNPATYQEMLYALLGADKFVEAKHFMRKMIYKGVVPSYESYKMTIQGLCSQNLLEDVEWVLKQMVLHNFVPRMGMWRQILRCIFSQKTGLNHIHCEEIIKN